MDTHSSAAQEINLQELLHAIWRGRWLVVAFAAAAVALAVLGVWLTPNSYRAAIVLSPVSTSPTAQLGGLSSLVSQFGGGLASLAGAGDSKAAESLAVLQSEALTESYIQRNNLLPVLYAKRWDPQAQRWLETDPRKIPTLWKANQDFKDIRTVTTDTKSGIVTMTITWKDANVAAKWANDLVSITNDYLRAKAIEESERNIAYLNEQATKTDVLAIKQAIYSILQNEINKAMLARGSKEYAFKILDPATAPEQPASPKPVIWVGAGLIAGILLSLLAILLREAWFKRAS